MDTKVIRDFADQLYDMAELANGGEHNLKAAAVTGSFDVLAFLNLMAVAAPQIIALIKALIGQAPVTPQS